MDAHYRNKHKPGTTHAAWGYCLAMTIWQSRRHVADTSECHRRAEQAEKAAERASETSKDVLRGIALGWRILAREPNESGNPPRER